MKTIKGRPVCATRVDRFGRAHLRSPVRPGHYVCGREVDVPPAPATGKSCRHCAELAPSANRVLRALLIVKTF